MRGGEGIFVIPEAEELPLFQDPCRILEVRLFRFSATAGGADVVEGDGAAAKEDEGKGQGSQSQRGFVSADQAVLEVRLGDGDRQINAKGEASYASEQPQQNEQAAEEFGEGGDVGGPGRKPQAGDKLSMVVKSTENLVVAVVEHDGAQDEAHDEEGERLQAVEVAQEILPGEDRLQQGDKGGKRQGKFRRFRNRTGEI